MVLPKCHSFVSHRYTIAFLCFLGMVVSVGYRTCFALVVTHIASSPPNATEQDLKHNSNHSSSDSLFPHCTTYNTSRDRQVTWTESTTFLFHTAFFVGQLVASFPAGLLAQRFSPKWIFGTTILMTSILFLVLPVASESHEAWVFVIRGLQGIVEAISVPSMNGFISSVASKTERARLINIAYAGVYLSPAVAMFTTGATTCYVSWDSMIYIYGAVGAAWSLLWLWIVSNDPTRGGSYPPIGEETRLLNPGPPGNSRQTVREMPWRQIFTSLPVMAVWVASFSRNVVFAVLITEVQQYFKDVYALQTSTIGLFAAFPHICMALFMMPGSVIFDSLGKKNVISLTKVRKLAQLLGYGVQGACFLAVGFLDDYVGALVLLCVGGAFSAFAISGFQTNPLDLAPQYAGALSGIMRTGMVGSVFSTVLASQLTGHDHSLTDWQYVFITTGSIHLAGVVVYLCFASANVQPWAREPSTTPEGYVGIVHADSLNNGMSPQDALPSGSGSVQGEIFEYDFIDSYSKYEPGIY